MDEATLQKYKDRATKKMADYKAKYGDDAVAKFREAADKTCAIELHKEMKKGLLRSGSKQIPAKGNGTRDDDIDRSSMFTCVLFRYFCLHLSHTHYDYHIPSIINKTGKSKHMEEDSSDEEECTCGTKRGDKSNVSKGEYIYCRIEYIRASLLMIDKLTPFFKSQPRHHRETKRAMPWKMTPPMMMIP